MQNLKHIDDEMLGAFADGQLDETDSETVIMAIDNDPDIKERYHRLRRAKDLMKLGFGNARAPARNRGKYRKSFWWDGSPRVAAAIAVIAVSFGAGKLSHQYLGTFGQNAAFPAVASAAQEAHEKIILHLSESDPAKFQQALEYMETFLLEHRESGGRIEVVANAGGIDLIRKDKSPLASKVASMIREHDNV
ncbi:MAG: hypothetical protein OEU51_09845, partial [Gammaproteobacteria bacterium]|nr:hypothetical protein [Gammaproteobacteria bacterium]